MASPRQGTPRSGGFLRWKIKIDYPERLSTVPCDALPIQLTVLDAGGLVRTVRMRSSSLVETTTVT
jgi:hypothetical protein